MELTPKIGRTIVRAVYDGAVAKRETFAEALMAAHAEDYPDVGPAVGLRVKECVDRTIAWLDAYEPPEQLDDGGSWSEWLAEAFSDGEHAHITERMTHLLDIADEMVETGVSLGGFLGQMIPLARDHAAASASGVRFMSMATSKGLTVEASIIIGAENGVVPSERSPESEERRLLYVAMTRARRYSYVTMATRRHGPTARSGVPNVRARRTPTPFLDGGPVRVEQGDAYVSRRWPDDPARGARAS